MATKRTHDLHWLWFLKCIFLISRQLVVWSKSVTGTICLHHSIPFQNLPALPTWEKGLLWKHETVMLRFVLPISLCVCVCLPEYSSPFAWEENTDSLHAPGLKLPILGMVVNLLTDIMGVETRSHKWWTALSCKPGHPWQPTKGRRIYEPPWLLPATCFPWAGKNRQSTQATIWWSTIPKV